MNKISSPKILNRRLNRLESSLPRRFGRASRQRVRELLEYQEQNPGLRTPYRMYFSQATDFYLYYELHPEWAGKSSGEMQADKESGASKFIDVFTRWVKANSSSEEQRLKLMRRIIPTEVVSLDSYKTIEDWIKGLRRRPEWRGKNIGYGKQDKKFRKFYDRFQRWTEQNSEDEIERRRFVTALFPANKRAPRRNYDSTEQWIKEFEEHPEWKGKSIRQMQKDFEDGGSSFYQSFFKWAKRNSDSQEEREKIIETIFKPKVKRRIHYKLNDWIKEFEEHPEWKGKTPYELANEQGSRGFYNSYVRWVNKKAKTKTKRNEYYRMLFPNSKAPFKFDFGQGEVCFDSHHERVLGILLERYGLICSFKEGKNLHVRTNGRKSNSIDFLVGNNLIEFHPVHWSEKYRGLDTPEKVGKRKSKAITNPEYKDARFWHIWDIEQAYNLLMDPEINTGVKEEYKTISISKFREHLADAHKKAREYDCQMRYAA